MCVRARRRGRERESFSAELNVCSLCVAWRALVCSPSVLGWLSDSRVVVVVLSPEVFSAGTRGRFSGRYAVAFATS